MLDRRLKQRPILVTPATASIIDIASAKAQCRIDSTDDDTLLKGMISAVNSYLDGRSGTTGRALLTQTWQQNFWGWPDAMNGVYIPLAENTYFSPNSGERGLRLPLEPVQSIVSVKYYDTTNTIQTVNPSFYGLYTDDLGSYCRLVPQTFTYPSVYVRPDAVQVQFIAGETATNPTIRAAALLLVQHLYQLSISAGSTGADTQNFQVPMAVDMLLNSVWRPVV